MRELVRKRKKANPVLPIKEFTLDQVIQFLQNLNHSNLQASALKSENERLKKEIANFVKQNEELREQIKDLEENASTIQEDYETLVKIMNRARKLVLFDEEETASHKIQNGS